MRNLLVVVDVKIEGVDATIFMVDTDVFEGATVWSGIGAVEEFPRLDRLYIKGVAFDIDTIVEAIDAADPGIADRPGLAVTLIHLNSGV